MPWYKKIGLNLLIVAISSLIGAVINPGALFTLLSEKEIKKLLDSAQRLLNPTDEQKKTSHFQ